MQDPQVLYRDSITTVEDEELDKLRAEGVL
jgi:hypothetical protein